MSTDYAPEATATELEERPRGRLVRSELRRITHRRFIRWLVILGALGYLGILAIAYTQYAKAGPDSLAQGRAQIQAMVDDQNRFREECLRGLPAGEDPDQSCPPVARAEDFGDPAAYVSKRPFTVEDDLGGIAFGIGVLVAGFGFLIGATWIGAEWSQKTLMALLFWEPRRLKVFAVKIGVLSLGVAAVALVAQLVWLGFGRFMISAKGSSAADDGVWRGIFEMQGRAILLAVLLALIGFGLANLIRNTGAALGIGFVYFIVELILGGIRPAWQPWYLTVNVIAFLFPGGLELSLPQNPPVLDERGNYVDYHTVVLSNWHGATIVGGLALALLLLGGYLFKRRDLT